MLKTPDEKGSEFSESETKSLRRYISDWKGDEKLKQRVLGWFSWLGEQSVASHLRELVERGILASENERAWTGVRNAVMHGKVVSPWTTRKGDEQLVALAELVHRLTRELIHTGAKQDSGCD